MGPPEHYLSTLKLLMGLFWTLTYVLIIKRGFEDHTFGMPLLALCTNISWECIFAFIYPHGRTQRIVNTVWFLFDGVILFQIVQFGNTGRLPAVLFLFFVALVLATAFYLTLFITRQFNDWRGQYTAFAGNLLMSILFISMLIERGNLAGQSIYIALFKLAGTFIPAVAFYRYYHPPKIINLLSLSTFVFDLIYVVLVYEKSTELGLNVWTRF